VARRLAHHLQSSLHLVRLSAASSSVEWVPNTDIYENEDSFVVRLELAGVTREDLHISITDRTLVVRGRRPDPCRTGHCHFRQMEIDYGVFERRFVVPRTVDGRHIKATVANGFLTIELPKLAKTEQRPLKVTIQSD
jgi:HSP20 family protein